MTQRYHRPNSFNNTNNSNNNGKYVPNNNRKPTSGRPAILRSLLADLPSTHCRIFGLFKWRTHPSAQMQERMHTYWCFQFGSSFSGIATQPIVAIVIVVATFGLIQSVKCFSFLCKFLRKYLCLDHSFDCCTTIQ